MKKTSLPTALLLGLFLTACGDPVSSAGTEGMNAGTGTVSSSDTEGSETSTSGSTSASAGEPELEACAMQSPFQSQECGVALKTHCRSMPDEQSCDDVEALVFDGGDFVFGCAWASVARFSDSESCTLEEVTGRCEGAIIQQVGCSDPCEPDGSLELRELKSIVSSNELVRMPCVPLGGLYAGPIGEWTALSYQEEFGPGSVVKSCRTGTSLGPAPICNCIAEACAEW